MKIKKVLLSSNVLKFEIDRFPILVLMTELGVVCFFT